VKQFEHIIEVTEICSLRSRLLELGSVVYPESYPSPSLITVENLVAVFQTGGLGLEKYGCAGVRPLDWGVATP